MGTCLRILVPDATTNYIQNPAMRYDTVGWNAASSTISRSTTYARFNIASLKVITSGSLLREGAYYRVNALQGISEPISVSAYARGAGRVHLRLIDMPFGKEWKSVGVDLRADRWTRLEVTGYSTGTADMRLYVETDDKVQAVTFYVDGAQMERKEYATTYCDGDQPGCRWNTVVHGSTSSRPASTRRGGRWLDVAGPCRHNDDIYFTVIGGFGMAPLVNNTELWPQAPGGYYENTKIISRVLTMTFFVKHKKSLPRGTANLSDLHRLRQQLVDVFKSDRTQNEPFLIEYSQGDKPLYLWAHYEGGLEGEWDLRNSWINSFPVRLLATSPFFFEDDQEISDLDFQDWTYFNGVAARIDGRWDRLNYGMLPNIGTADGPVVDFELGDRGQVWAGGSFRYANANAGATDPMITPEGITYWNGTKWVKISAGANAVINDLAVAPNGYVYVTGAFTSIGGVAANGVAYWDGAAWNAMGTGISGVGGATQGLNIAVAPNGGVYLGGSFTSVGGRNCRNVGLWWGGAWQTVGAVYGGFNGAVNSIAISEDGLYVYFGGDFTDRYTLAANALLRVAKYTVSTNAFSAMGLGFNNSVYEVVLAPTSGKLYACGAFTASGTGTINRVAAWMGTTWIPMGTGANAAVNSIAVAPNGDVVAVGQFSQMDGLPMKGLALWNGSGWVNLDVEIAVGTTPTMSAVQVLPNGDIYLGGTSFSTTQTVPSLSAGITLVRNSGTSEVRPVIYVAGQGTLRWIENQTTGKRVFLNLQIFTGEEIFIDFDAGTVTSLSRGNLFYTVVRGSELHSFSLIPGENKIAAFMAADVGASMQMYYTPQHWSADAVETVGAL